MTVIIVVNKRTHVNTKNEFMTTLEARLLEERLRIGMSQSQFSDIAGVHQRTQINYEKGTRNPDAAYLLNIAEAGVDVGYVLGGKRTITEEEVSIELRYLADAFEAIDTALFDADKFLPPNKKRQAAEALYMAFKEGEVDNMGYYAGLMVKAA